MTSESKAVGYYINQAQIGLSVESALKILILLIRNNFKDPLENAYNLMKVKKEKRLLASDFIAFGELLQLMKIENYDALPFKIQDIIYGPLQANEGPFVINRLSERLAYYEWKKITLVPFLFMYQLYDCDWFEPSLLSDDDAAFACALKRLWFITDHYILNVRASELSITDFPPGMRMEPRAYDATTNNIIKSYMDRLAFRLKKVKQSKLPTKISSVHSDSDTIRKIKKYTGSENIFIYASKEQYLELTNIDLSGTETMENEYKKLIAHQLRKIHIFPVAKMVFWMIRVYVLSKSPEISDNFLSDTIDQTVENYMNSLQIMSDRWCIKRDIKCIYDMLKNYFFDSGGDFINFFLSIATKPQDKTSSDYGIDSLQTALETLIKALDAQVEKMKTIVLSYFCIFNCSIINYYISVNRLIHRIISSESEKLRIDGLSNKSDDLEQRVGKIIFTLLSIMKFEIDIMNHIHSDSFKKIFEVNMTDEVSILSYGQDDYGESRDSITNMQFENVPPKMFITDTYIGEVEGKVTKSRSRAEWKPVSQKKEYKNIHFSFFWTYNRSDIAGFSDLDNYLFGKGSDKPYYISGFTFSNEEHIVIVVDRDNKICYYLSTASSPEFKPTNPSDSKIKQSYVKDIPLSLHVKVQSKVLMENARMDSDYDANDASPLHVNIKLPTVEAGEYVTAFIDNITNHFASKRIVDLSIGMVKGWRFEHMPLWYIDGFTVKNYFNGKDPLFKKYALETISVLFADSLVKQSYIKVSASDALDLETSVLGAERYYTYDIEGTTFPLFEINSQKIGSLDESVYTFYDMFEKFTTDDKHHIKASKSKPYVNVLNTSIFEQYINLLCPLENVIESMKKKKTSKT